MLARLPIRARLTLLQVGVFGVIVLGLATLLVVNQRVTLERTTQESLELTSRVVVNRMAQPGASLAAILGQATVPGERGTPEVIGQVLDAGGGVVHHYGGGTASGALVGATTLATVERDGHWHGRSSLPGRDDDDMVIVLRLDSGSHRDGFLVLAETLAPVDAAVLRLVRLLGVALPLTLVVAVAAAWFVAGRALRPVDELTRRAAAVDPALPPGPLPVPPANDEIARLAVTLNAMLQRLHRALEVERRIAADASHELRTPLGVMEAELDVALRSRRTPPEAREVLASVREEVSALGRIVANLLVLSRAEARGDVPLDRTEVDLLDLAYGVAGRYHRLAADRGVTLAVEGDPVAAEVDDELLRQALSNLVQNALAHTDAGGSVALRVAADGSPRVEVVDTGVGIPDAEIPHLFDRFYRVDRSRSRDRGGSGLGLEITRRIVEAHGGTVDVSSQVGRGSTFTIRLPQGADGTRP